jgi:hypothetical protein
VSNLTIPDQLLFNVFAYAQPSDMENPNPPLIAKIYSRGPAVKSWFGDTHLMFAHNDFARDIEIHPEWEG